MKIGIIGAGLIGNKRAAAAGSHPVTYVCDTQLTLAESLRSRHRLDAQITSDWKSVVASQDVDIVIISVTNNFLAPIAEAAFDAGKHVLVEKPAARSATELAVLVEKSNRASTKIKVGFNLRYHPALSKAKSIVSAGEIGDLMFLRGRYGHGGRVGYEKEWRAQPEISGGGELLDQGVHLIDLSRWFLGDFETVEGHAHTYFWNMPVDDNGFLSLQTPDHKTAWLHVSCSEWKNMFSLEIYGKTGKLQVDGLGGSYGVERLTFYKMHPEMGPPETTIWEYHGTDLSWQLEFDAFIHAIQHNLPLNGDIQDAHAALQIVEKIYSKGLSK